MAKDHPFNFGCHKCGFCEVKHVENDRSAIEIEWYYIVKPSRSISTYQHSISIGASWWFMCELHPFNPKNCHYSSVISITPNKLAPAIRSWPNEAPGTKSGYHSPKENWGNLPAAIPTRSQGGSKSTEMKTGLRPSTANRRYEALKVARCNQHGISTQLQKKRNM